MRHTIIQQHVYISGRVQGVYFRQSTAEEARKYRGLKGFVKNLPDGRVEALFVGDELAVNSMVAWCYKGPPAALVTSVEVIEEKPAPKWENAEGFSIRY